MKRGISLLLCVLLMVFTPAAAMAESVQSADQQETQADSETEATDTDTEDTSDTQTDDTPADTEDASETQAEDASADTEDASDTQTENASDTDAQAESDAQEQTSSDDSSASDDDAQADTQSVSMDAISYIYIEASVIGLGEELNIAAALADEAAVIESASLTVTSPESGITKEMQASAFSDNAVLFTFVFEDADEATNYELTSFAYTLVGDDTVYVIEMETEEGNYAFDVVSEDTMDAIESAGETSDDDDALTVYAISEDGTLEASDSAAEALEAAQAGEEESGIGTLSTDDDFVIALDPGHGGSDGGATANGLVESELNWTIMTYCKAELEEYAGVTVFVTKSETETLKSLETRVTRAVNAGADVFISIHCNAGGASGAEVWVPNDSSYMYSLHTIGEDLGESILEQLAALGLTARGVYTRDSSESTYSDGSTADYYGVIRYARKAGIVGIIIEHAFVDNSSNAAFLKKESNLKKLGIADATGIAEYYGLTKIGTPELSSAAVSNDLTSVTLTWTKADNADGYEIYRKCGSDGTYTKVKTISSGSTLTWTDSSVEMGSTYYYKVRAYDSGSSSKAYGEYSSAVKAAVKPSTVTLKSVSVSDDYDSVTLKWGKISNADGYRVYRKADGESSYSRMTTITSASTVSWTDTSVESGTSYTYRVRAYRLKADGTTMVFGEYSSTKTVTTQPDQVVISSVSLNTALTKATIKWTAVSGSITGYRIYRATGSGSYTKIAEITDASTVSYTDSGLSLGKTYKYKIRAYKTVTTETTEEVTVTDESGNASTQTQTVTSSTNIYGSYSSAKSVTTKPSTVTISSAAVVASSGGIKVTWKKVSNATGYVIYRSTNGGSYSKVKTITSNSTLSWTNVSVKPGRVYRYKIRAYTKSGSTTVYSSSYSSVKKVTAKPAKVTISSITSTKSRSGTVKWAKVSNATGYQVAYRIKGTSKWYYTTVSTNKKVFTLLRNKKYYVKVRAYTTYSGTKYYGSWSSEKLMTVK